MPTTTTTISLIDKDFVYLNRIVLADLIRSSLGGMKKIGITDTSDLDLILKEVAGILKKTDSDTIAEALAAIAMAKARKNRGN